MRGPNVESEVVESTRAEKVLAVGLVLFLLIGGWWVMERLGSIPTRPDYASFQATFDIERQRWELSRADQSLEAARQILSEKERALAEARADYEFRREEYRVALEEGRADAALQAAYVAARERLEQADREHQVAERVFEEQQREVEELRREMEVAAAEANRAYERALNEYEVRVFALRMGYALPTYVLLVALWLRMRARHNKYLLLFTALMAFGFIQLVFLLGSFTLRVLRDLAQIIISVVGGGVTAGAFILVRRHLLDFERLARLRRRRSQCVYCGFPLGTGSTFCPDCGERARVDCPSCGGDIPLFSSYCPHCGARGPAGRGSQEEGGAGGRRS